MEKIVKNILKIRNLHQKLQIPNKILYKSGFPIVNGHLSHLT
jgi:hypothetical protein